MHELWEQARRNAVGRMEAALKTLRAAEWSSGFESSRLAQLDNALAAAYLAAMMGFERAESTRIAETGIPASRVM